MIMRLRQSYPPCIGAVHVIPVPAGMTPEQAWEEITTLGRLADPGTESGWAAVQCPGGADCRCRHIDRAWTWRSYRNDRLVAARIGGAPIPQRLLPVAALWFRLIKGKPS